jgi:hypothetical protein
MHYIGVTYEYQRLLSYPTAGQNETQTHAILFFYTLYATSRFSVSFSGVRNTRIRPASVSVIAGSTPCGEGWTPAAGASLSWQARLTNIRQ